MKPPHLDASLTKGAILHLYGSVIALGFVGSIAFSNKQIFGNKVYMDDQENVYSLSQHTISDVVYYLSPATPLMIFTIVVFLIFALSRAGCCKWNTVFKLFG
jgi:hypothetical protein